MGNGYGLALRHGFIVLDGSYSMKGIELKSQKPKHECVAAMVQEVIDLTHNDQFENTYLTVMAYDADQNDNLRITELMSEYNVQEDVWAGKTDLSLWDPLNKHGGNTPIGRAIEHAREKAEAWINNGFGQESRRAVIFLLSDGMNNVGPNGLAEKNRIAEFNQSTTKGQIRLATVGYFQSPEGGNKEESDARNLLRDLPHNVKAYFEADDAMKIAAYILATLTQLKG